MNKTLRNIISTISIIAIILAPLPQNSIVTASDIIGTDIESEEQTETAVNEEITETITEETVEETQVETIGEITEETAEETTEETTPEPIVSIGQAENSINNSAVLGDSFQWVDTFGSEGFSTIYVSFDELNSPISLSVPDYYVPEQSESVSVEWSRYEFAYQDDGCYYDWTFVETIQDGVDEDDTLTTAPITKNARYACTVTSDEYGSLIYYFTIIVRSNIMWAEPINSGGPMDDETITNITIDVAAGSAATLSIPAYSMDIACTTSVKWFISNDSTYQNELIEGENGESIVTEAITRSTSYTAIVIDEYGNTITAYYRVRVNSGLMWNDGSNNYYDNISVVPNQSFTITLREFLINDGENYYIGDWFLRDSNGFEGSIENTSGLTSYTTTLTGAAVFNVSVYDDYGNTISAEIYVTMSSGLAWGTGDSWCYTENVDVKPGDSVTLNLPTILINDGCNYSIAAWRYSKFPMHDYSDIDGTEGQTSYTIPAVTESGSYIVWVYDEFGNSLEADFNVSVNSSLAWADGNKETWDFLSIQPEYSASLAIPEFVIDDGLNASISWGTWGNDIIPSGMIEGADQPYYITPALTGAITYYADVSDEYGNTIRAYFQISIDSGLRWTDSNWQYVSVKYGDDYNLVVPAFNIADGLNPSIKWYVDSGMDMPSIIEGETSTTLALSNITYNNNYICEVSDGYNTISSNFQIRVTTGLSWLNGTTRTEETIPFEPGMTLPKPEYNVLEGVDTSYYWTFAKKMQYPDGSWYYDDGGMMGYDVTCEEDGSVIIDNLETNSRYTLIVSDSCGNTLTAIYNIVINTGLAWSDGSGSANKYINVKAAPGGSYTIEAPAITYENINSTQTNISYIWYVREKRTASAGYDYYSFVRQADVVGTTLTLSSINERTFGYVLIVDQYGNELNMGFEIAVDTGLSWKDGSLNGSTYVEVPYGASFDMWIPDFNIDPGLNVNISVEGMFDGAYDMKTVLAEDLLQSDPVMGNGSYHIWISDDYGNTINFVICYRNNYSLSWTNGNIYYMQNINMNSLSDTVTLQLPEYKYDGEKELKIYWSGADGRVSEDYKSITIEGIEKPTIVYARVFSDDSSAIIAAFNLGLESSLSFADGSDQVFQRISASGNEPITLNLPEIVSDGELTYQWMRMSKDMAGGAKKGNIGSGDYCYVANPAFSSFYYACVITDQTGHRIRALYDILAPAHEYDSHGVCNLCGKYEAQAQYVSITLDGRIGMNFYIAVDQEIVDSGAYAVISHGDESETIYLYEALKGAISSQSVYKLTYHVDAKDINDPVSVKLYNNQGRLIKMHNASGVEISSYEYSVAQYLSRTDSNSIAEFKALVEGMSVYGNLAALYFGTSTGYEMSEDVSAIIADYSAETVQEYAAEESGNMPEGISYYGTSLVLDSDTSIYHYFVLDPGHTIDEYRFTVDGINATPVAVDGMYRVEINSIVAADLGKTTETVVSAVSGSYTICYSAYSYVYAALSTYDDSESNLLNAVKALYLYGNSAKNYFLISRQ